MKNSNHQIGLSLVAGRRPDLLQRTLESFQTALFDHVDLAWVRVNLDPIFGTPEDGEAVVRLLADHFTDVELRQPERPGFCAAVKWLWGGVPDGPFFHLEDDWLAAEPIDMNRVSRSLRRRTTAVCLRSKYHGTPLHKNYSEFWGLMAWRDAPLRRYPIFNTSPSFFDGAFARGAAALMDPELDPEKQMHPSQRLPILRYLLKYRCRYYFSETRGPVIIDIGRDWRAERGIEAHVVGAAKTWTGPDLP